VRESWERLSARASCQLAGKSAIVIWRTMWRSHGAVFTPAAVAGALSVQQVDADLVAPEETLYRISTRLLCASVKEHDRLSFILSHTSTSPSVAKVHPSIIHDHDDGPNRHGDGDDHDGDIDEGVYKSNNVARYKDRYSADNHRDMLVAQ
jgi:hypothetical protein